MDGFRDTEEMIYDHTKTCINHSCQRTEVWL